MSWFVRLVVYPIVAILVLLVATTYGDIWDRRANPVANVDVMLHEGAHLRGELSREWSGRYIVTQADAQVFTFGLEQVDALTMPPAPTEPDSLSEPASPSQAPTSIDWSHWRSYLVLYGAIAGLVALLVIFDHSWARQLLVLPRIAIGRRPSPDAKFDFGETV